ncbi:MAG: DUF1826 domain-containing protein [Pseudomonadota bacterium]
MTHLMQPVESVVDEVVVCNELDKVAALKNQGVAAAIWHRKMPEGFQSWMDNLSLRKLPSARVLSKVDTVRDTVMAICNSVHVPYSSNRRVFINDVGLLAEQFAQIMNVDVLQLRFDVIDDDACRKFHIDAVTARLVCTYRGPGTQYGISIDGNEPERVFSVPTGSPILLRGTKWSDQAHTGLLHRSPPIAGTDITRLVLVIDAITPD